MRRLLIPGLLALVALVFTFGWVSQRPPVPVYTTLGNPVKLDFGVNGIDGKKLEIALAGGAKGSLFVQFEVGTEGSALIVTLNGAGGRSAVKKMKRGEKLPEWSFLKSQDGKPALTFTFVNQLVELEGDKTAVRMRYAGPDVPLLKAVKVGRPTTLPPFLGKALGHDGPVQLQPGTYPVDADAGVTIHATLLGR